MPDDELTGVNESADAGQEELNLEDLLQDEVEETGEEEVADAEPEVGEETTEQEPEQEDRLERAFAKKWAAQKDKLREEIARELKEELRRETVPQQRAYQQTGEIPSLSDAEAERLAEQLEISPNHVRILYAQQMENILLRREVQDLKSGIHDTSEKAQAQQYVREITRNNPALPAWDEKKLAEYRNAYYRAYGQALPWREAYRQYVADTAMSGDLVRQTQQQTIQKIKARDQATVRITAPSTKKPTIEDLPKDQFEKLVEMAKSGLLTKMER